jgi:hypothetical protein
MPAGQFAFKIASTYPMGPAQRELDLQQMPKANDLPI